MKILNTLSEIEDNDIQSSADNKCIEILPEQASDNACEACMQEMNRNCNNSLRCTSRNVHTFDAVVNLKRLEFYVKKLTPSILKCNYVILKTHGSFIHKKWRLSLKSN